MLFIPCAQALVDPCGQRTSFFRTSFKDKKNKRLQITHFIFLFNFENQIPYQNSMLNRAEILNYLRENKEVFRNTYGIRKIALFGSYARDEQTDQSDVDILIEMASDTEDIFDKRLQLKDLLMKRFVKNVDICHEQAIKPIFRDLVLKDAVYA